MGNSVSSSPLRTSHARKRPGAWHVHRYALPAALVMVLACFFGSYAQTSWSGKCVGVSDGDTIRVLNLGKAQRIRLFGVDCPEKGQPFGQRARQFTASLVFGKVVIVEPVTRDRYGRVVAWVSADGTSLNHELVKEGLAWWYRRHAAKRKDLERLEEHARTAEIGLWSMTDPVPPWEFRRKHKQGAEEGF